MDNKIKHLELIQSIVSRMSNNSFMLKGWTVTLVAGIFALAGKDAEKLYLIVAFVPVVAFWGLDSFYLLQERLYRSLYDKVRQTEEDNIDFSLKAAIEEFGSAKNCYCSCLFSNTEKWFYIPIILVCIIIVVLTY